MAAAAATSSRASLSLRGSSFQEFNGLVALPSARLALPSPAQGVMRRPVGIEAAGAGLAGRGVRIRLVRFGRKKLPSYRIIIANSRSRRDGRFLEMVGHYNPMPDKNGEKDIQVNGERIKYWMSVGAQPSDTVRNILYRQGVLTPPNFPEPEHFDYWWRIPFRLVELRRPKRSDRMPWVVDDLTTIDVTKHEPNQFHILFVELLEFF